MSKKNISANAIGDDNLENVSGGKIWNSLYLTSAGDGGWRVADRVKPNTKPCAMDTTNCPEHLEKRFDSKADAMAFMQKAMTEGVSGNTHW